jgi:hypothetical protein
MRGDGMYGRCRGGGVRGQRPARAGRGIGRDGGGDEELAAHRIPGMRTTARGGRSPGSQARDFS